MGRRGKSAKKAARAARAAARRAAEEELRAAVEREGDARRQAAYSVAKAFVKQFMPRAERMGAFCGLLKLREMKRKAKKNKTAVMYESLVQPPVKVPYIKLYGHSRLWLRPGPALPRCT